MSVTTALNLLNAAAGALLCAGIYLEYGLGYSLIAGGMYLAYNTIATSRQLNVRDSA